MKNEIEFIDRNKSGIYEIRNTVNGKVYIGSAVKLSSRFMVHKHLLLKNKHHSRHMQSHCNKYGIDTLIFRCIEIVERCDLIRTEQHYLDTLKPYLKENGFNTNEKASSMLGFRHSIESINKMTKTRTENGTYDKGRRKVSEETREKLSKALKGRAGTNKGIAMSDAQKIKISESNKGRSGGFLGKKHSERSKMKMSKLAIGNKNALGFVHSKERNEKISKSKTRYNSINQISKNGELLRKWNSIREASDALGISKKNLNSVLNGHRKSCGGFKWEHGV